MKKTILSEEGKFITIFDANEQIIVLKLQLNEDENKIISTYHRINHSPPIVPCKII